VRTTLRRTADYLLPTMTLQEAPERQNVRLKLDQSSLSLADPHLEPHHYFHHLVGLLFVQRDRPALALTLARLGRRPRHNDLLLPLLTRGDRAGPSRWASLDSCRTGGLSYASQRVSQRSSCNRNGDLPADAEPPPAFPLCAYIHAVLRWVHFKHDFPCGPTQAVDVVTHIWQRVACVIIASAADSSWVSVGNSHPLRPQTSFTRRSDVLTTPLKATTSPLDLPAAIHTVQRIIRRTRSHPRPTSSGTRPSIHHPCPTTIRIRPCPSQYVGKSWLRVPLSVYVLSSFAMDLIPLSAPYGELPFMF
jgi:hypothetical protein